MHVEYGNEVVVYPQRREDDLLVRVFALPGRVVIAGDEVRRQVVCKRNIRTFGARLKCSSPFGYPVSFAAVNDDVQEIFFVVTDIAATNEIELSINDGCRNQQHDG